LKRIIFDHNVPARLARLLKAFDIKLARDLGWHELRNGELLSAAEEGGFDVLLTGDKSLPGEQNMVGRKIGIVTISVNNWNVVRDHAPAISEALHKCKPGQVTPVFCGIFTPRRSGGALGP
jgi:predicted nuclease of predicted toxin-antitoxin system